MEPNLQTYYKNSLYEAGCDEAGRGCLAGPVFGAAVMLDPDRPILGLNDSKKLSAHSRLVLKEEIEDKALSWAVVQLDADVIDQINILRASLKAMSFAVLKLDKTPRSVLVDGTFKLPDLPHPQFCFVKGDGRFQSIAAASILAKTYRDLYMEQIHFEFPVYLWNRNKGYPTDAHRKAIEKYGLSVYHRKSFSFRSSVNTLFDA